MIQWMLIVVSLGVALPMTVVGTELILSLLPLNRKRIHLRDVRPAATIIIPAHNEQENIECVLRDVRMQAMAHDSIIVVADNCSDLTVDLARRAGAVVWERSDTERRGKGYALCFAFERLKSNPPEAIVVLDADCRLMPDTLDQIIRAAVEFQRPVQSAYLMTVPSDAVRIARVSAFAVVVKNYLRPRALQRVGLPCLLTGSGMAFPWKAIASVPHPENELVEDMRFSIELTLAGFPPLPMMEAVVVAELPETKPAFESQRTRWEHGHLRLIFTQCPRLLWKALTSGRLSAMSLSLELSVPPLTLLLVSGVSIAFVVGGLGFIVEQWLAIAVAGVPIILASVGLLATWWRFGRAILPFAEAAAIPAYLLAKIPIYLRFLMRRQTQWVRTERSRKTMNVPRPHLPLGGDLTPVDVPSWTERTVAKNRSAKMSK